MPTSHSTYTEPSGTILSPLAGILSRNWWAVAIRGVLAIILGIIAFWMPGVTMLSLAIVFAAYAVVDGVLAIISGIRAAGDHRSWGWPVFGGLVSILVGVAVALWPGLSVEVFVLFVAAWAIVTGLLTIGAAFGLNVSGRGWLLLGGFASVLFGVLLIVAPLMGALVLTWWLGAFAIIFGVSMLVLGFKLKAGKPA